MSKKTNRRKQVEYLEYMPNEKDFETNVTVEPFKPRNRNQAIAYEGIRNNYVSFLISNVGVGKTFLAIHYAIDQLLSKNVKQIIITRPATIDEDEQLGYLKGDMQEKISPLILPMRAEIEKLIGKEKTKKLMEEEKILGYSLAHLKGMNCDNSIILLDEAQNAKHKMLKTFLTRIHDDSKAIVMGDRKQIDLKNPHDSCLWNIDRFRNKKGIHITEFTKDDIIRGKITKIIDSCYEDDEFERDYVKELDGNGVPINLPTKNKNINDTYIANWY